MLLHGTTVWSLLLRFRGGELLKVGRDPGGVVYATFVQWKRTRLSTVSSVIFPTGRGVDPAEVQRLSYEWECCD